VTYVVASKGVALPNRRNERENGLSIALHTNASKILHGGLDDKCASKKSEEKLNQLVFGCSKQVMAYPQVEAAKREEDKVEVRWNSEDKSTSKSYQINFKIDNEILDLHGITVPVTSGETMGLIIFKKMNDENDHLRQPNLLGRGRRSR